MKFAAKILLCLLLVLAIAYFVAASDTYETSLKTIISETKGLTEDYVAPTSQERAKMTFVIRSLLDAISDDLSRLNRTNELARELGFEVIRLEHNSKSYIVLREAVSQSKDSKRAKGRENQRGGGIYIFRQLKERKREHPVTIIHAPHSRYERGSGYISRLIFENTGAFALFVNTAHRYSKKSGDKYESDVAHSENTYFHTITKAVCDHVASALVIQVHGYNSKKYGDKGKRIGVVLSDGKRRFHKDPIFRQIAQRFTSFLGEDAVGVFGVNFHQLGATTNVQARYINRYSDDTFIHVEISEKLRQDFISHRHVRTRFIEVFR